MSDTSHALLDAFETHSLAAIQAAIEGGADPQTPVQGKPPIDHLIQMYTRSSRFASCLRLLLDAGATIEDPALEALLLDDAVSLSGLIESNRADIDDRFSLDCAYTSLRGVAPLHICAEYNAVACARALLESGANVNARAAVDDDGIGGQTPIFHAVNSNRNYCRPIMELLVDAGADLEIQLEGLIWGRDHDWETVVFDVTPISYAQCGLYPQFHRLEQHVYGNIEYLYRSRYGKSLPVRNIPNRYIDKDFRIHAARSGQHPE